jgi:hypothetical protein
MCVFMHLGKKIYSKIKTEIFNFMYKYFLLRTNQTLDKHVGDSTDSDNEEKEGRISMKVDNNTNSNLLDGELEEGEVEEEFDEIPQQKDGMYRHNQMK